MVFARVCAESDIVTGDMEAFFVDGWEVLVVRDRTGTLRAMDGICPHEDFPLVHGSFDGTVLTCAQPPLEFRCHHGQGHSSANLPARPVRPQGPRRRRLRGHRRLALVG